MAEMKSTSFRMEEVDLEHLARRGLPLSTQLRLDLEALRGLLVLYNEGGYSLNEAMRIVKCEK